LINEPWTPGDIGDIWSLIRRRIRQWEAMAWRKVKKECPYKQLKKQIFS
jgi:DNA-directed RNA polymerase sigma subunit (sigma70/sigma32)